MASGEILTSTCTTCPYCGVGCGVVATLDEQGEVSFKGDESHPANFGKLCSKGSALAQTLGDEGRLLYPQAGGVRVSWDDALDKIAHKFSEIIDKHGPGAVAIYASGQLLTEDYYVANKLMKGFIGSANIDTNSRLCMASSVVGHKRAFGADIVPGCYEDFDTADLVVLTGSNLAWCHPILYQRIVAAKAARPTMKIVVIDPRETATCDIADLHLPLKSGSDVALFQGLLKFLDVNAHADETFVEAYTNDAANVRTAAQSYTLARTAKETGLSECIIETFFQIFADTSKTVTVYSQGVNQARNGSDKVNAIINCHLLTGRIGKAGAGPFSVTGQPNAMGGREVGGLANQLACHMEIENPAHRDLVQRFWKSPTIASQPGLKAVDLFEAIHAGTVKAVWILATNPVVSMPDADRVRAALKKCEMVIVSDIYGQTDTAACADIILPATGWGEKDGSVTNSERRISRQRAFLTRPGEARHDWQALCGVAKRMGWEAEFSYQSSADIFREYAGLSGFENIGDRDFDLSGLVDISDEAFDTLNPIQWPVTQSKPNGTVRFFEVGEFYTANGKANFVPLQDTGLSVANKDYPLMLNTGRIRDHWHTMTRTGRAARLSKHIAEPFVEISPDDAENLGLKNADIAILKTVQGEMLARVCVTKRQRAGSIFVPMHFTDQFASKGRAGALVAPITDPVSGQPAFKSTLVTVSKFKAKWYGFAALAADHFHDVSIPEVTQYWAKARTDKGVRIELAGRALPSNWQDFMRNLMGSAAPNIEFLDMISPLGGQARLACFEEGRLTALLYTAQTPVSVSRDWACAQLMSQPLGVKRHHLLAGRPGADMPDKGAIICACMDVGLNDIHAAISKGCPSVSAIGDLTTAGTNCGSCQPEIRAILNTQLQENHHVRTA